MKMCVLIFSVVMFFKSTLASKLPTSLFVIMDQGVSLSLEDSFPQLASQSLTWWGRAVGKRREHIKERQPSVCTGSKQLVEDMQGVWTKTDKMEDDRKHIPLPFTRSGEEKVDHQSPVMSQSPDAASLFCFPLILSSLSSSLSSLLLFLIFQEWW